MKEWFELNKKEIKKGYKKQNNLNEFFKFWFNDYKLWKNTLLKNSVSLNSFKNYLKYQLESL